VRLSYHVRTVWLPTFCTTLQAHVLRTAHWTATNREVGYSLLPNYLDEFVTRFGSCFGCRAGWHCKRPDPAPV